jgi:hypothetical protein
MPSIPLLSAALLLLAAACASPAPAPEGEPSAPAGPGGSGAAEGEGPLVSSLSVRTGGEGVDLLFQVTTASDEPVQVTFNSGQSYDFAVRQDGRELWRWSADMGFTMAIREVTVAPGETLEFTERWTPPAGTAGALEAEATLASSTHPLTRTAQFRLP